MQKNNCKMTWSTHAVVMIGTLIAMTIVLSRMLAIDLGFARFTLGSVCTIMAGLWFGPLAGAVCGFAADILGCLIQGYAVNPLITIAAILWGVLPALSRGLMSGEKAKKAVILSVSVVITSIVCTLGFTYAGLVWILGYNFYAILPTRLAQFAAMTPVYCVLVCLLYFSPISAVVRQMQVRADIKKASETTAG